MTTVPTDSPVRRGRASRGGWMFLLLFAVWILVYVAARTVLDRDGLSMPMRATVAALPIVVLAGVFIYMVRALRRADELERFIHLLSAAIALPLIAVTILAIALFQSAGIIQMTGGAVPLWPLITLHYLLGYGIAWSLYRPDPSEQGE